MRSAIFGQTRLYYLIITPKFMSDQNSSNSKQSLKHLDPERYNRLRAETKTPYRGLRQFVYVAFGASGLIGAIVFLAQILVGRDVVGALPNFALQIGVVALMVWLFRWEGRSSSKKLNPKPQTLHLKSKI
jgi:Low psii accumulation1 / Rep27